MNSQEVKCPRCDGNMEFTGTDVSDDGKEYTETYSCPSCGGPGAIIDHQTAQIEALLTLVVAINARDAVEGSPQSFNSGKEYRRTLIEAIDEVKSARAKCRELGLEV